jgi:hypothetical protein
MLSKWKKNEVRLGKYLHQLYLNNFSDKNQLSENKQKRNEQEQKMDTSMDVGWLDSMDTQGKNGTNNTQHSQDVDFLGNGTQPQSQSKKFEKRRLIETYNEENLEGFEFYTVPFNDMMVYCQHIDFHSIGKK